MNYGITELRNYGITESGIRNLSTESGVRKPQGKPQIQPGYPAPFISPEFPFVWAKLSEAQASPPPHPVGNPDPGLGIQV